MKKVYIFILMIVITGLIGSCSSGIKTAKLNYNNKSNPVTAGSIVKRKYQKGFYVDLFKSKKAKKNTATRENITNPYVATKTKPIQVEDNNRINDVYQTSNNNSNLIASNNNKEIVFSNSTLNSYTIPVVVNNKTANFFDVKQIKQKLNTNRIKSFLKSLTLNQVKSTGQEHSALLRNMFIIFGWILWGIGLLIMFATWGVATAVATHSLGLVICTLGGIMIIVGYIMKK